MPRARRSALPSRPRCSRRPARVWSGSTCASARSGVCTSGVWSAGSQTCCSPCLTGSSRCVRARGRGRRSVWGPIAAMRGVCGVRACACAGGGQSVCVCGGGGGAGGGGGGGGGAPPPPPRHAPGAHMTSTHQASRRTST
jgi:hypothetical protein